MMGFKSISQKGIFFFLHVLMYNLKIKGYIEILTWVFHSHEKKFNAPNNCAITGKLVKKQR